MGVAGRARVNDRSGRVASPRTAPAEPHPDVDRSTTTSASARVLPALARGRPVPPRARAAPPRDRPAPPRARPAPSPDCPTSIGQRAEDRAVAALVRAGYRVVERNVRLRVGELDVVAYDGDVLVFVEVRSRADDRFGGALHAVPPTKQRQVARAAAAYLALRRPPFRTCRFDVVLITGPDLQLMKDAFRITW